MDLSLLSNYDQYNESVAYFANMFIQYHSIVKMALSASKQAALVLLLCFTFCGCQLKSERAAQSEVTIVASRLFPSRTYENFIERLDVPCAVRWINASELSTAELDSALSHANGILLTGGADIHPDRYGQAGDTVLCGSIDLERDELESILLGAVDSLGTPLLGICRGMQFMNVHNGGSLHPHLPDVLGTNAHRGGTAENRKDTLHMVEASISAAFLGVKTPTASQVTSHHHQGINALAPGLMSWAVAPDGLIEAVRRRDTIAFPCYIGVQYHPERSGEGQALVEPVGQFFLDAVYLHANRTPRIQ